MICEAGQGQLKLVEEKLELWVMPILLFSSFSQRRLLQEGLIKFQIEPMHIPVSRPGGAHGGLTLQAINSELELVALSSLLNLFAVRATGWLCRCFRTGA